MQQFLELCKDKNKRYDKFCLISNQKISDIATKTDEVKFLNDNQIERYGIKLGIDEDQSEDHDCLGKMAFLVIQDSLGLEYLIQKEILTFDKHISHMKTNCIRESLIELVQRSSRSSHKEDSRHYTLIDNKSREELKRVNATITVSQISEIIHNCRDGLINVENKVVHELIQSDDDLITQCIDEANEDDENIAYTALVFLEHLGRDMKIYDSKKLQAFLKRSIYDDNKIAHLSSYLDIIKRILHTSTKLDNNPRFQIYVKKSMRQRLIEIITTFDDKYWNSKSNAFQIIDDYEIVATNERTELYVKTLLACIRDCDHAHYQHNMESLTFRIPHDTQTVSNLRRLLIRLKKSIRSATVQERCDSLLQYYK